MNASEPWEFGYAFGVYRPLALRATPDGCGFCRENFMAGVEVYGGLGTTREFGFGRTSHYVAPTLAWDIGHGTLIKASPNFGLTDTSVGFLMRFGVWLEISQFGKSVQGLFR